MSELGDAVMDMLDQIVDRVIGGQPARSDGKPVNQVVYSHMRIGRPIDVREFADPWSPAGGSTLQSDVPAGTTPTPAPPPPPAADIAAGTASAALPPKAPAKPQPDPRFRKSIQAAFNTALLTDELIQITNDGSYEPYATGRSLSVMWDSIINAMQPIAVQGPAPDVLARIDAANKVLNVYDEEGEYVGKSRLYKTYQTNSEALAKAKLDYAHAQAEAMADATKAEIWPQDSMYYQNRVDTAWDDFRTEGAQKVEAALDTLQSVGVNLQARLVAQSRKLYDAWNLGLAGVPSAIAYAQVSPYGWYDHRNKELGFTKLEASQFSRSARVTSSTDQFSRRYYSAHNSTSGGSAHGSFLGWGASASGTDTTTDTTTETAGNSSSETTFHDAATGVSISLEWGLCTIQRPWLLTDLFHMANWYLVGNKQNAISTGSVDGQVMDQHHLMPSLPTQFLVIRDVRIFAEDWGLDADTMAKAYADSRSTTSSHSSSRSGSVGWMRFGGSASRSSSGEHSEDVSTSETEGDSGWSWKFENGVLEINGSQIIGWISEVVPSCPPKDDPQVDQKDENTGADAGVRTMVSQ